VNDAEVVTFGLRIPERRAKQLMWLDDRMDADEALELSVANWVVPVDDLEATAQRIADKLVEAPPEVLALSKATFQFAADRAGERDVNRFHLMAHQVSHHTSEAMHVQTERQDRLAKGGSAIPADQARG
jgi:enoyl-CoA hydratase